MNVYGWLAYILRYPDPQCTLHNRVFCIIDKVRGQGFTKVGCPIVRFPGQSSKKIWGTRLLTSRPRTQLAADIEKSLGLSGMLQVA